MTPIHITTLIDSETLHLPELGPLVGKTVEITIIEHAANGERAAKITPPADSSLFMALKPAQVPMSEPEWQSLREVAKTDSALAACWSFPNLTRSTQTPSRGCAPRA